MSATPAARPTTQRSGVEHRVLLDRAHLTIETPNFRSGRVDRGDPDHQSVILFGDAPRNFHVTAILERQVPYIWIGIDADPLDLRAPRTPFAVLSSNRLRELAVDVLRCYPAERKGGAR